MNLNEYQQRALTTARYAPEHRVIYNAFKLAGEAGEIADKLGKGLMAGNLVLGDDQDGHPAVFVYLELQLALRKELGDVLWHLSVLAHDLDLTLEDVAQANLQKLRSRSARDVILGDGDDR